MRREFVSVAEFGPGPAAELLTRAFADYLVPIALTEAGLHHMVRSDSLSLADSCVILLDGWPAGAGLVARRGSESRVAGMAFVPEARRGGHGRALVEHLQAASVARGDRRLVLEVIEQNTAAVKLYEATGFKKIRRLLGFAGAPPAGLAPVPELAEVGVRDVAAALAREAVVDWPWQIAAETIMEQGAPATGYTLDGAWCVVLNPAGPRIRLRALVAEGIVQREERAARLLRAVMAKLPAEEWSISALWPQEFAGWFTSAGLARTELSQWQMQWTGGR